MNNTTSSPPAAGPELAAGLGSQNSNLVPPPAIARHPGETPRAFGAFLAWYQLGPGRSLPAVAECLGEGLGTIKKWSTRYQWRQRLLDCQSVLLAGRLEAESALHHQHAADWARRSSAFREQKWDAGQKLLSAGTCYLESFGDRELGKMTLAQVSRAIQIAARLTNEALRGDLAPESPAAVPLQAELEAALTRAYGPSAVTSNQIAAGSSAPAPAPATASAPAPTSSSPS